MSESLTKELHRRPGGVLAVLGLLAAGLAVCLFVAASTSHAAEPEKKASEATIAARDPAGPPDPIVAPETEDEFPHDPPDLEYFPCSDCHEDREPNPRRRELEEEHTDIVLHHGTRERWCFDCHNPDNRDKLRLASGTLIDFDDSYRLCGQCHGPKLRDWRIGIHGKRTGQWNGKKKYYLCANCHNPHSPKFKPLKPLPPPVHPSDIR